MLAEGHLVEEGQQQRRENEGQVDDDEENQFVVGDFTDVEERLEQVDRGNRDDRGGQLDLERAGVELAEPGELVGILAGSICETKFS